MARSTAASIGGQHRRRLEATRRRRQGEGTGSSGFRVRRVPGGGLGQMHGIEGGGQGRRGRRADAQEPGPEG
jgi:hypothetical protein